MKRYFFVYGLFFCFLISIFFVSFSTKAETDLFIEIDTKINNFSQKIIASGRVEECESLHGRNLTFYWNKSVLGANALLQEFSESMASSCYQKTIKRIDNDIYTKILIPFRTSGLACQDFSKNKGEIDEIMSLRWNLFYTTFPLSDRDKSIESGFSAEACPEDPRSLSFERTSEKWEDLKTKWKDFSKFFSTTSSKNIPQNKSTAQQEEMTKKLREARIQENAKKRAQDFVNDFVQSSFVQPLYAERSEIESRLKGLPNGKSTFVRSTSVNISDIFTPVGEKNPFSKEYEKKIKKLQEEQKKEFLERRENFMFFLETVEEKKSMEEEKKKIHAKLVKKSEALSVAQDFKEPLADAMIQSLQPFHTSLQETTFFLNGTKESLELVLNRQNTSVTGR